MLDKSYAITAAIFTVVGLVFNIVGVSGSIPVCFDVISLALDVYLFFRMTKKK